MKARRHFLRNLLGLSVLSWADSVRAQMMPFSFWKKPNAPIIPVYCLISGSTTALTSPDGTTWTQRTLPSGSVWISIARSPTTFCMVAQGSTAAATSPDGINWTAGSPPNKAWGNLSWNGTRFLASTGWAGGVTSSNFITSTNGTTWSNVAIFLDVGWATAASGTGFCAVTESGECINSTNGTSWSEQDGHPEGATHLYSGGGNVVSIYANGASSNVFFSTNNGVSWTSKNMPSSAVWSVGTYGNSTFCLASPSTTKAAISTNGGSTWTAKTLPVSAAWTDIAYG
ncbi:MAG: hypothetical protein KF802_16255 [Bdellovibrionaceae bacterium]|nr:hypothetical protein [Pseudobdellovibrionaceae bacterium]